MSQRIFWVAWVFRYKWSFFEFLAW